MSDLWFDQQAFIDAAKEKNDQFYICRKEIIRSGNEDIGLLPEPSWQCERVQGYTLTEKLSQTQIEGGKLENSSYVGYVLEKGFDPNSINSNTYFFINQRLFQVELVDILYQRNGVAVFYKYKLSETNKTIRKNIR